MKIPLPDNVLVLLRGKEKFIALAFILIGLAAAISAFQKQQAKIAAARQELAANKEKLAVGKDVIVQGKKFSQLKAAISKKEEGLNIPKIKKMISAAKINELSVTQEALKGNPKDKKIYTIINYKISVEGDYHNLGRFISALESRRDVLQVEQITAKIKDNDDAPAFGIQPSDTLKADIAVSQVLLK